MSVSEVLVEPVVLVESEFDCESELEVDDCRGVFAVF